MNPINITVKSKKFDANHAQWSLRLIDGSCKTFMCDTIYRADAANIAVIADLAAIWTALQQIRGYQWIEINSINNETETVLTGFLYHQPPAHYENAYHHFKYFIDKHDLMINPDGALRPIVKTIMELNPAMRTRVRRASQLVTMGAISRHPTSGYSCWTKSHPEHPYHIKRNQQSGLWECNCPDENAPIMMLAQANQTVELPVCKHLLAAMMSYRCRQQNLRRVVPIRKAA